MLDYARALRAVQAASDEPFGRNVRRGLIQIDRGPSIPPHRKYSRRSSPSTACRIGDGACRRKWPRTSSRPTAASSWWTTTTSSLDPGFNTGKPTIEVPSAVPPSSSKVGEHVQWLAECQVRGRDEAEVARSAGLVGAAGTMKVRRAIHVLAQLIGLSLSTKTARATTPHTARDAPASEITARDIDATLPRGSQPEFRTRVAFCTRQRSGTPSTNSSRAGLPSCAGSFSTKSSRVVT
jgi:hypothetical protein